MEKINILFELGTEEIPSGYINGAISNLEKGLKSLFKDENLSYNAINMFSTPRRMAFNITGLQSKQHDEIIERIGPTIQVAYDSDGNLTKAAQGFLRSGNASIEDIYQKHTKKGDKIAIKKEIKGKATIEILSSKLPEIILSINFPKTMKWGNISTPFVRPVRWILALQNDRVWDFSFENIKSSNITYGNRFLGLDKKIVISSIDEYEKSLEESYVIAKQAKRKEEISRQLKKLEESLGLEVIEDKNLLDEVTNLIEFPTAVTAEFDKKYLALPQKIITSTLSKNQKYFALTDSEGNLSEKFIFVSNGDSKYNNFIKIGNQKVVKPRLDDAVFYFEEDTKHPLEYFVPKLKEVTFHRKIGTLFEKTIRIQSLAKFVGGLLQHTNKQNERSERAAYLCKADLVALMLGEKEFTKLQGYIGGKYAEISGEDKEVAIAIEEHYLPKGKDNVLPKTLTGAVVAIADKMDTVCSIFAADQIPSGSNDPFALRRAANGVVKIIDAFSFNFNIFKLIDMSFELLNAKLEKKDNNKNLVYNFFKSRINWLLSESGIDYDVIESVTHIDYSNISNLKQRAMDLQKYKENDDFRKLVIAFKRVSNIIEKHKSDDDINEALLKEDAEKRLYAGIFILQEEIKPLLNKKKYIGIMDKLVAFSPVIDKFFDDVLVNVKDADVRLNRYSLLLKIRKLFLTFADLNKIE